MWKKNQWVKGDQWVEERKNEKVVEYKEECGSYKIYTYMKTILKRIWVEAHYVGGQNHSQKIKGY